MITGYLKRCPAPVPSTWLKNNALNETVSTSSMKKAQVTCYVISILCLL